MRVKLPIQKIRPEQVATPRVGLEQECLVGRAVITWARLEASLHDLIWTVQGKGLAEGREETKALVWAPSQGASEDRRRVGGGRARDPRGSPCACRRRRAAQQRSQFDCARDVGRARRRPDRGIVAARDDRPQRRHLRELPSRPVARFHPRRDGRPRPSGCDHRSGRDFEAVRRASLGLGERSVRNPPFPVSGREVLRRSCHGQIDKRLMPRVFDAVDRAGGRAYNVSSLYLVCLIMIHQ